MTRSRNYCFTLNNWTPLEIEGMQLWKGYKYLILGKDLTLVVPGTHRTLLLKKKRTKKYSKSHFFL